MKIGWIAEDVFRTGYPCDCGFGTMLPADGNGGGMRIDEFCDLTLVINLRRRPDRWERIADQCRRYGCEPERIEAIDGRDPEVTKDYARYAKRRRLKAGPTGIGDAFDFYTMCFDRTERAQYVEATTGKPAIASSGAWAYLRSYRLALETALARGAEIVLILDDDCLFHRRFNDLLPDVVEQLTLGPFRDEWLLLQLGNLQFHWGEEWVLPISDNLYVCSGATVGSHAVAYRREAIIGILESLEPPLLPYDTGALSDYVQRHRNRCFVTLPNLAIQDLSDTDIGTSAHHAAEWAETASRFRWRVADYEQPATRAKSVGASRRKTPIKARSAR